MEKNAAAKAQEYKILLCKEVAGVIGDHFRGRDIPFIPVNAAHFYLRGHATNPVPSRIPGLDFLIGDEWFNRAVESMSDITQCKREHDLGFKSIFSYPVHGTEIRFDLYRKIPVVGRAFQETGRIFSRAVESNGACITACPEDLLLILCCKIFQNIGEFFDPALFSGMEVLAGADDFSWDSFWRYAPEYRIEKFAAYLLLRHKHEKKSSVVMPKKFLYATVLSNGFFSGIYPRLPRPCRTLLFKIPFVNNPAGYCVRKCAKRAGAAGSRATRAVVSPCLRRLAKKEIIAAEFAVYHDLALAAHPFEKTYTLDKPAGEPIIFSSSTGLWVARGNTVHRIAIGTCYGITRSGRRWYAGQRIGTTARIVSFELVYENDRPEMHCIRTEVAGLPPQIHQIDRYEGILYITDTFKNRVLCIDRKGKRRQCYPNRGLKSNCPPLQNNHFNSVFITGDHLYVAAHNGWLKQPRGSEIFKVNRNTLRTEDILETRAEEMHNVLVWNGGMMYCDSKGGRLIHGDTILFHDPDYFFRGLAVTPRHIIVGGSEIIERSRRWYSDSVIWFLNQDGTVLTTLDLNKIGQVNDIRGCGTDFGLSQSPHVTGRDSLASGAQG